MGGPGLGGDGRRLRDRVAAERLPAFLDEVHDAFDRYWTPPPPIEEQLAAIERARQERAAESRDGRTRRGLPESLDPVARIANGLS